MSEKAHPKGSSVDMHMTAQEVADHLGVSRQLVADIENRVLRKIRKRLLEKGITAWDILPD